MCRFYSTKDGIGYTRLCYKTGRRGERIKGPAIPEGKRHVTGIGRRAAAVPGAERVATHCIRCGRNWHVARFGPTCDNCLKQGIEVAQ